MKAVNNGGITVELDLHSRVTELLILMDIVLDGTKPPRSTHEGSIVVGIGKRVRDEHAHGYCIMAALGLVPGVFEGENPPRFLAIRSLVLSSRSILDVDCERHHQQDTDGSRAARWSGSRAHRLKTVMDLSRVKNKAERFRPK